MRINSIVGLYLIATALPLFAQENTGPALQRQAVQSQAQALELNEVTESRRSILSANQQDTTIDSVAEDLQKIVVLCAVEPDSDWFLEEWQAYVEKEQLSGDELDSVISDVIERAASYRRSLQSRPPANTTLSNNNQQKMMHDTAMAIIRKL